MSKAFITLALAGLLTGCSVYGSEPTIRPVRDAATGQYVGGLVVVNTGDQGSGKISSVLGQLYTNNTFRPIYGADGLGVWQTFTEGGLAGIAQGAGLAAGLGIAGAASTTISNIGNSSGIASATGGTAAAAGGAGGRGGKGGAGGAGGAGYGGSGGAANASLSASPYTTRAKPPQAKPPHLCQNPVLVNGRLHAPGVDC